MLSILGRSEKKSGFCDGFSRRGFLQIGGAAMGGLALNEILQMEAQAGVGRSHKAIINIYLPGGPSHLDMWDLKPNAPTEIRGEFEPIATNVPGVQICELFPRLAKMMDKFAIIRSLSDSDGGHDGYQCMTGRKRGDRGPNNGWPMAGAWVSRLAGEVNKAVPPNLALMYTTGERPLGRSAHRRVLGSEAQPLQSSGQDGSREIGQYGAARHFVGTAARSRFVAFVAR